MSKRGEQFLYRWIARGICLKSVSSFSKIWKNKFTPTVDKQIYEDGVVHELVIADTFSSFFDATSSSFSEKQAQILK